MGPPRAGHSDDRQDASDGIAGKDGIREKVFELRPVVEAASYLIHELQPVRSLLQSRERRIVVR